MARPTHTAESSGAGYDQCQWDENWKTGDLLVIESERIVAIVWAWPLAVTAEHGQLHNTDRDPRTEWEQPKAAIAAAVDDALTVARSKGWSVAAWAS